MAKSSNWYLLWRSDNPIELFKNGFLKYGAVNDPNAVAGNFNKGHCQMVLLKGLATNCFYTNFNRWKGSELKEIKSSMFSLEKPDALELIKCYVDPQLMTISIGGLENRTVLRFITVLLDKENILKNKKPKKFPV